MKKIFSLLLCHLAGFGTAHADEGMCGSKACEEAEEERKDFFHISFLRFCDC